MNYTVIAKRAPLFVAISLASGLAIAQQNQTTEFEEEVVVVGNYLNSLQSAMNTKRNAASLVEAIAAEDIGQLPDVSISDSLKRLPGLAQDRDRGNGSQISIRGMGGMLGFTTLNGREVAILEETRNIRYDQFPAELISGAQVYKSPLASLQEGGVSGSVNLSTIKPLDHKKREFVVDLRASSFELGKDIDLAANNGNGHRISVSYIDQFLENTLGVALGYSGRSEPIATARTELWNYGDTYHNEVWSTQLNSGVAAPWGGSYLVTGGEDERQGFVAALTWQANDYLTINYDGFWSAFDIQESYQGFDYNIKRWGNGLVIDKSAPTAFDNLDMNNGAARGTTDLLAGTVELASLRNLNEMYEQDDELVSHGVNAEWQRDVWTLTLDLATSETTRDKRWASLRTVNNTPGWGTFSTTGDGRMQFELENANLTTTAQNTLGTVRIEPLSEGGDQIDSAKFDVEYEVLGDFLNSVQLGVASSARDKHEYNQKWDQVVLTGKSNVLTSNYLLGAQTPYWSGLPQFLAVDRDAVIRDYYGELKNPTPQDSDDRVASWDVSEDIFSQYIQLNFATETFGKELSGNLGVRNVTTETESTGYLQGTTENDFVLVTTPHEYDDVLPSTNWTLALTDEQLLRFGAAKTIARAPVNMMSPSLNLNEDLSGANPGQSTAGNPTLDPFRADQLDLGYEWYYSDRSQVALNLFYKDLESYITRADDAETVTYKGTEYTVSRPVNGSGGYIRGYEVLWQQAFDFLPAPFNGFGVYTNYAHNESNVEQFLPLHSSYKAPLTGLSEHVANFTLWYYLNGFEARTSYSYRSEFQRDVNLIKGEEGMNDAEGYWDLNLSYTFNDHYKVYFQVQNLTNEPYKTYGLESNNPNHVNRYEEFGSRYSLGVNWKL
ncbi:MAG TPA: TonB-dependent receptor [Cellvibrio sp.]|nr:TonB-dependent receptor [Cellvibrio sp.]